MKIEKKDLSKLLVVVVMLLGIVMSRFRKPADATVPNPSSSPTTTVSTTVPTPAKPVATSTLPIVRWPTAVSTTAVVMNVVDGDTVDLLFDGEAKVVRVRLLGINTPESVDPRRPVQCFGKEASKHVKELLTGKRVADISDPKADDRDKYGRLLRGLVTEDQTDVNATLVAQGYAHAYLDYPLDKARKAELRRLQEEAKTQKRGLWNEQTCNGAEYK